MVRLRLMLSLLSLVTVNHGHNGKDRIRRSQTATVLYDGPLGTATKGVAVAPENSRPGSAAWRLKSFAEKGLPWVVDYVRRQRQHHANGTTIPKLEECGDKEDEDENKDDPQGDKPEPPEG